jgi:hypothetical protein
MTVETQMECRLAGETEVLGENLPQRHFCPSQNPAKQDPGLNPDRRGGKPATNRLSYGAAMLLSSCTTGALSRRVGLHGASQSLKTYKLTSKLTKKKVRNKYLK